MLKDLPSKTFSNLRKRNDVFLVALLLGSLSLNVYFGWSVRRLKRDAGSPPNSAKLVAGVSVHPIMAVSLAGKQETITYQDNAKPTVVYVFSPSCIWCERNTQNINAIVNLREQSFRFIGLSLVNHDLREYVQSHHFSFPVYQSLDAESIQTLGLGSTPQTLVISPEGRVLKNWTGAFSKSVQAEVEEYFDVHLPGLAAPKS